MKKILLAATFLIAAVAASGQPGDPGWVCIDSGPNLEDYDCVDGDGERYICTDNNHGGYLCRNVRYI